MGSSLSETTESHSFHENESQDVEPSEETFPTVEFQIRQRRGGPKKKSSGLSGPRQILHSESDQVQSLDRLRTKTEREHLLGPSTPDLDDSELSKERNLNDRDNVEKLIQAQMESQDQIAGEMLHLTRSLKEQSLAAKEIIRKDIRTLETSNKMAEENALKLGAETQRLKIQTQLGCRCWIWTLLLIVVMTFIAMVWIMKFFKKRKDMY